MIFYQVLGMIDTPIHVIDFEGSRQSGIVEYGVATLLHHRVESTSTGLCRPQGTISDIDRSRHRIREEAVAVHSGFESNWDLFSGLRESGVFCAHNAIVEDGFLRAVWPCPRRSPDFFGLAGGEEVTWGPWLDTLPMYRRIYPDLESYSLEVLVGLFGLQPELDRMAETDCPAGRGHYHAALYDALASALLLARLFQETGFETVTLHWLLRQSQSSELGFRNAGQQQFNL